MSNKYLPLYSFLLFAAIGVTLWLSLDVVFYLFNFIYIGSFLSLGAFLTQRHSKYARNIVQIGVGLYMFGFLGLVMGENMQIEGFWYFLFLGVFQAAVIHYSVAKIAGPFLFGRGWCGYACWTAAVLDLLPYKTPKNGRVKRLGILRYILFGVSFCFVAVLFALEVDNLHRVMYISFIVGNLIYYIAGIVLALIFKDNRAFCKYVCPITTFLKPASYFSLLRIRVNQENCIHCGKCKKACPMDVDMLDNKRSRENGTECILCYNCVKACPKGALK